jgi:transcriptional regulator with XRE-family HTH domain
VANDFVMRLLARIKTLREAQGLTQESFAERAGLKYKHYQAIEAGRKPKIQLPTLIKIAEACDMKPHELLNFDLNPAPSPLALASFAQKSPMQKPGRRAKRSSKPRST